jgi:hypothetical protein
MFFLKSKDFCTKHTLLNLFEHLVLVAVHAIAFLQVITAFQVIKGTQGGQIGHNKLTALKANSNFFRSELIKVTL